MSALGLCRECRIKVGASANLPGADRPQLKIERSHTAYVVAAREEKFFDIYRYQAIDLARETFVDETDLLRFLRGIASSQELKRERQRLCLIQTETPPGFE